MTETDKLLEMWADFIYDGRLSPDVREPVADGWRRCRAAGVDPNGGQGRVTDPLVFQSILDENKRLIETALPIMHSVFEIIEQSHFQLVLTDSAGYILESVGDQQSVERTEELKFVKGTLWSNLCVGTNAISVALDSDIPIQMRGPEHYCRSHHVWTCSAAPIHGVNGEVLGCLNLSGEAETVHPHTLAVVIAAAYGIEGQLKIHQAESTMRSALESSSDSIIILDEGLKPLWMNSDAARFLGIASAEEIDICRLMPDVNFFDKKPACAEHYFTDDTRLNLPDGRVDHCAVSITSSPANMPLTVSVVLKKQAHLIDSANRLSGNRAGHSIDDICRNSPEMRQTMALAMKFARYDGNILIEGESGVGKELVAQAIHNESRNAPGPFVSVNCASIPREFLDAELFGFEAGAFGRDYVGGNPGRFELANHGTLFLDEICAMPLEFQPKLLRAVEKHRITRVGGTQEIELDIRIIASTNRRPELAVRQGILRQDLFYRLNVLRIEVPPLRERPADVLALSEYFLKRLNRANPELKKSMSPEYLEALRLYKWPGNVRELENGIERAFYSAPGSMLDKDCLQYTIDTRGGGGDSESLEEAERLIKALTQCGGDVEQAAAKLEMSRATFYRYVKKYHINVKKIKAGIKATDTK